MTIFKHHHAILFLDNDRPTVEIVGELLEILFPNLILLTVASLEELVAVFDEWRERLLLVFVEDHLMMSGKTAIEIIHWLRAEKFYGIIAALYDYLPLVFIMRQAGCEEVLSKPFSFEDLERIVRIAIRRHEFSCLD